MGLKANVYNPQSTVPGTQYLVNKRILLVLRVIVINNTEEKQWTHKQRSPPSQTLPGRKPASQDIKGHWIEPGTGGIPESVAVAMAVRAGVGRRPRPQEGPRDPTTGKAGTREESRLSGPRPLGGRF